MVVNRKRASICAERRRALDALANQSCSDVAIDEYAASLFDARDEGGLVALAETCRASGCIALADVLVGNIMAMHGDLSGSEQSYRQAMLRGDARGAVLLGNQKYRDEHKMPEAIEFFELAIRAGNYRAAADLAELEWDLGDYESCLEHSRLAIEHNAEAAGILQAGYVYYSNGDEIYAFSAAHDALVGGEEGGLILLFNAHAKIFGVQSTRRELGSLSNNGIDAALRGAILESLESFRT